MDETSTDKTKPSEAAPEPQPATTSSGAIDRSNLQSVYPEVGRTPSSSSSLAADTKQDNDMYANAGQGLNEAITLIAGIASSITYTLVTWQAKSYWIGLITGTIVALVAVFFAIKNHRSGGITSPLIVIGLSAATIMILNVMNTLLLREIFQSSLQ